MTWSYDPTLATTRDKVRFEIQDTESLDPLFSNEEIDAKITLIGENVTAVALDLARKLMMKFARLVDVTVGKVSEANSQRFQAYKAIVDKLAADATALCIPSFGGVNVSANEALDADTSLVQPSPGAKRDELDSISDGSSYGGG